ncbi:hypothetical protein FUT87_04395 [Mitsuaria sp. TWR114]|jgi:hypothetical protein|uniref:hypothetical protein n=1 Tax=unclassified Roseateles TaxID=2626991 RepID=UPI0008E3D514|nr:MULTISPECIES: hypothetical protein [unclassified Roseateles]MBB3294523.1 hypothetical protein [Mitsuaria sp. BK041]MBB3363739.1 hypothetical protein [Mitsuaria sp. BK045]TXD98832.1 hypothetical protein FUT87_04395 [Mitsuaria sp. TWR114]SFR85685.1 hypothetical protein SAMN05428960_2301 [Mitsuaria sp. PDC51]
MKTTRLAALFALLAATALQVHAADAPPPAPAPAETVKFRDVPEVKVEQLVNEDDKVRIEETRVRGLTQKVVVKNKDSKAPEYEILLGDGGRDIPTRQGADRGNAGSRVWRLFNF